MSESRVISLFSVVFFLLAAWYLYVLLKPVNKNIALLFLLLNLGGFAIWCFSLLNLFAGLLLLSGADYLKVFQPDQLQAQAMLFINLRKYGAIIAQIPYGIWLFPLGYLVFKSGFLPKILGILLIVDCFGLLIYVFQCFLLPGYEVISYPCMAVSFIAELSLTLDTVGACLPTGRCEKVRVGVNSGVMKKTPALSPAKLGPGEYWPDIAFARLEDLPQPKIIKQRRN